MQLGKTGDANQEFQAAAAAPDSRTLATTAIGISLEEKDKDAAIQFFRRQAKQHEDDFLFQYLYAKLLLGKSPDPQSPAYVDAKRSLARSIALNSSYAKSHVELGKLYVNEGRLDDATRELEAARKLDEGNRAVYVQLAKIYRLSGKPDLARAASSKLRELNQAERNASGENRDRN